MFLYLSKQVLIFNSVVHILVNYRIGLCHSESWWNWVWNWRCQWCWSIKGSLKGQYYSTGCIRVSILVMFSNILHISIRCDYPLYVSEISFNQFSETGIELHLVVIYHWPQPFVHRWLVLWCEVPSLYPAWYLFGCEFGKRGTYASPINISRCEVPYHVNLF